VRPRIGRPRIGRLRIGGLLAAAVLLATSVVAVGCSYSVVVTNPPPLVTSVPIEPTGWPNGTTGTFGLRIDPSLLSNIPSSVGGNPLLEDVEFEMLALDDPNYASPFDAYYVAHIDSISDLNWLEVSVASLREGAQTDDFYASWRDSWFKTACSQADGIDTTTLESINDWQVDVATCKGGVMAYTLSLGNGILVSIMDLGPRRLGRQLIEGIN
jgi:hypothetical protein